MLLFFKGGITVQGLAFGFFSPVTRSSRGHLGSFIVGTEDWRRREENLGADFENVRGLRLGQREGWRKGHLNLFFPFL